MLHNLTAVDRVEILFFEPFVTHEVRMLYDLFSQVKLDKCKVISVVSVKFNYFLAALDKFLLWWLQILQKWQNSLACEELLMSPAQYSSLGMDMDGYGQFTNSLLHYV